MTMHALLLVLALQQQHAPAASLDSGVILQAALDSQPQLLNGPRLYYPLDLLLHGVQGRVVVQFILDTMGRAESRSIRIIKTPHMGFNLAAKEYVAGSRWQPAWFQRRKVRALMQMPIDFKVASAY